MPKEMTHADYLASPQWRAWERLVQDIDNDCGGLVKSIQEHLHEDAAMYLENVRKHLIKAKEIDPQMEDDGKCLCCGEMALNVNAP